MNILSLRDVQFSWAGRPLLLSIDHVDVSAGEVVMIHGPSGSGKTTLLSLMAGVITPQAGRVEVLGEHLGALSAAGRDRFRGEHIGFIFRCFKMHCFLPSCFQSAPSGQWSGVDLFKRKHSSCFWRWVLTPACGHSPPTGSRWASSSG